MEGLLRKLGSASETCLLSEGCTAELLCSAELLCTTELSARSTELSELWGTHGEGSGTEGTIGGSDASSDELWGDHG